MGDQGASAVGRVVAVCAGPGGIPKHPVDAAACGPLGLEGDGHRYHLHGGEARALCLLFEAEVRALAAEDVGDADGLPPGTFGENLRVAGLDPADLRPGDRLTFRAPGGGRADATGAADAVTCELTDVRSPCKTLTALDPRFPDLMLGRSGFVARVVTGGRLAPGMEVRVG